jgi:hypothetical protein
VSIRVIRGQAGSTAGLHLAGGKGFIWPTLKPRRLGRGVETQPPPTGRVTCGETQRLLLGFTSFNPTYGLAAFWGEAEQTR